MTVTTKDVALDCGVSDATVSHILANGKQAERYSRNTRDKVTQAARRLGYRPNVSARAIRKGRFFAAGMMIPRSSGFPFSAGLVRGAIRAFSSKGIHVIMDEIPEESLSDTSALPQLIRRLSVDGILILHTPFIPANCSRAIEEMKLPAVFVNAKTSHDCVHPDDYQGGRDAAKHLLSLGHTQIAYLTSSDTKAHYSITDRLQGLSDVMGKAGLKPRHIALSHNPDVRVASTLTSESIEELRRILSGPDSPTAVVCYDETETVGLVQAAAEEGIRIPEDLSVSGFHMIPQTPFQKTVTTWLVPTWKLGAAAANTLIRKIAEPNELLEPGTVPLEFVEGNTCRKI